MEVNEGIIDKCFGKKVGSIYISATGMYLGISRYLQFTVLYFICDVPRADKMHHVPIVMGNMVSNRMNA